jgi:hypothetical protein
MVNKYNLAEQSKEKIILKWTFEKWVEKVLTG